MNSKFLILTAALAVAMVSSCQKESSHDNTKSEEIQMTFHASFAGATTRTAVQENGTSVWWTPGDRIRIFYGSLASGRFTSTNSDPAQVADFTGTIPLVTGTLENEAQGASFWSVYPYNEDDSCDGESVTLTVSDKQLGAEGTFAQGQFPAIAKASGLDLAFYNVCGGLVFTVASEGIRSVTFEGRQNETVAGTVKVGFNSEGVPAVESVSSGKTFVKLEAPAKGTFTPGVRYFITLLPGTFAEGYTLTFKKDGEEGTLVRTASTTINRSRFRVVENADSSVEYHEIVPDPKNIVFADDLVKAAAVAAFDTDGDGELSYAEAAAVTEDGYTFWEEEERWDTHPLYKLNEAETKNLWKSFDELQYFTGITAIPGGCFSGCELLTSVRLPEQLLRIENDAFRGCVSLPAITIPNRVETICENAFLQCKSISSVTIPNSVTTLGQCGFEDCVSLSSVTLSDNITSIEGSTFSGCTKLSDLHLPSKLKKICNAAFNGCENIPALKIPNGIETIEDGAFYKCRSLKEINLPEGLTSIGDAVFEGCSKLSSIILPASLSEMGHSAFVECSQLESVIFKGNNLSCIREETFKDCSSLLSISIPNGITIIKYSAFSHCKKISSISIPNTVEEIEQEAFYDCSSLVSINLPAGLLKITYGLFGGCSSLPSIIISDTVREIEGYAFENCASLTPVNLPKNLVKICEYAFAGCSSLKSITIPEGVTIVKDYAFTGCSSLESANLPSTLKSVGFGSGVFQSSGIKSINLSYLTTIPSYTFDGCEQLEKVVLANDLTDIEAFAFWGCSSLQGINFPTSLRDIQYQAFWGAGLKTITIPENVEHIGWDTFSYCYDLTEIILKPLSPPAATDGPFTIKTSCPIYVPNKSVGLYKSADGWSGYEDRILPISERNK